MNDEIPSWAIDLIKQIERLNEKLPTHVEWVEQELRDHEFRLRSLERRMWVVAGAAAVIGALASSFYNNMV